MIHPLLLLLVVLLAIVGVESTRPKGMAEDEQPKPTGSDKEQEPEEANKTANKGRHSRMFSIGPDEGFFHQQQTEHHIHHDGHIPLRIAQVVPLLESVPPKKYGGLERVVYYLVEELAKRGHEVTLFASADSTNTSAKTLVAHPDWPSKRYSPGITAKWDNESGRLFLWQMEQVRRREADFDILHFHTYYEQFGLMDICGNRCVTTLHSVISSSDLPLLFDTFHDMKLVSISDNQRTHLADHSVQPNYGATIYHGIPEDLYKFTAEPEGDENGEPYLAFLGRITDEKRPDLAIQIAVRAGIRLKIAAKIEPFLMNGPYWKDVVEPLLDQHGDMVKFIGQIDDEGKETFLGNALALLFPIDWPEPFGVVMIESMACGTPVLARPHGSVPEVIEPGVTGLLFDTVEEGVEAVRNIDTIRREGVRKRFEERFTAKVMADNYEKLFRQMLK